MANLLVNIGANIDALKAGLGKAESQLQDFGKKAQSIGLGLTKTLSVSLAAVGTAAFANTVRIGNYADKLLDLEQQTGLSTDALQKYRAVATQAGIATDAVANASENLQRRLASGEEGSADLVKGLESIGVASRDASGGLRSIDSVVEETIKKLADIEDITQRNQLAFKIFGRSASELAPLLSLGSAGIEEATQKAEKLGLVLSRDALEAANAFRVEFDFLKSSLASVGNELGLAFLPVAEKLVQVIQSKVIPAIKSITNFFSNLSDNTKTVIAVIGGLAAGIGPLLVGLGSLLKILPLIKAGFVALTGPIGLITLAVGAAVVLIADLANELARTKKIIGEVRDQQLENIVKGVNDAVADQTEIFKKYNKELSDSEARQKSLNFLLESYKTRLQDVKNTDAGNLKRIIELNTAIDTIQGLIDETGKLNSSVGGLGGTLKLTLDKFKELAEIANQKVFAQFDKEAREFNDALRETLSLTSRIEAVSFAGFQSTAQFDEFGNVIEGTRFKVNLLGQEIQNFGDLTIGLGEPVKEFADSIAETFEKVKFNISDLTGAFSGLGNFIGSVFNNIPLGSFLGQFASFVTEIVAGAFAVSKANAIAGATKSSLFTGPAAAFTLPAFIASSVGLVASAFAGLRGAGSRGSVGGGGVAGVGSGVGSTFEGGGTQFLSNNIELALVPEITGDSIRFVLDKSNQYRN